MVYLQPLAPAKPALGAPCNGCGLCCLAEPCPLGVVLSRKFRGACVALQWDAHQLRYRCGALARWQPPQPKGQARLHAWLARWVRRWIGAGVGCDASLEAVKAD